MTLFCYQKIQTISNIYSILFEDTIWTGILRSTVKKKVVIFGRGKKDCSISLEGSQLGVINFKHLGVTVSKSNVSNINTKELYDKANKTMYVVISKCRKHNLSTDFKLDMFDKVIKPIPSYGLEVWGYYNNKLLEKLQLKFCKYILSLKTSTL